MKRYWFGVGCESQWTAGSSRKMVYPEAASPTMARDRRDRAATAVSDPLAASEQARAQGRRQVVLHDGTGTQWIGGQDTHTIEREPSNFIVGVSGAWPKVISNLKSLLETGSPILQDPIESAYSGKE